MGNGRCVKSFKIWKSMFMMLAALQICILCTREFLPIRPKTLSFARQCSDARQCSEAMLFFLPQTGYVVECKVRKRKKTLRARKIKECVNQKSWSIIKKGFYLAPSKERTRVWHKQLAWKKTFVMCKALLANISSPWQIEHSRLIAEESTKWPCYFFIAKPREVFS